MTKEELIKKLKELEDIFDKENAHITSDKLLIEYINDNGVKEAFDNIQKWYS